jgi:hypothetical protein
MKRLGKWDHGRDGSGYEPDEHGLLKKVDSLVESAFNSEKCEEWLEECGVPHRPPPPSEQSDTDFYLFESTEEDTIRDLLSPSGKKEGGTGSPTPGGTAGIDNMSPSA